MSNSLRPPLKMKPGVLKVCSCVVWAEQRYKGYVREGGGFL